MSQVFHHHSVMVVCILLVAPFALGCSTVIPVSPIDADEGHGLLFGNMHLVWNETEHSEGFKQPVDMKWWIEEETQGKRYLTVYIPTQGPFTLKLPAGSYRVREMSFYSWRGIWHTALPTTFQIQPRSCTSLGAWKLQLETGSFGGWVTREVDSQELPPQDFQRVIIPDDCPTAQAPLDASVRRRLKLNFHATDPGRF
jgi:hypothetical protein